MKIHSYIQFTGNCNEAMAFYQRAFGGEFADISPYRGSPMEGEITDPAWLDKMMHMKLILPNGDVLMGTDVQEAMHNPSLFISLNIAVDTPEEAHQLFDALSEGSNIAMPVEATFWSKAFGMLTDKYGVGWSVNCD